MKILVIFLCILHHVFGSNILIFLGLLRHSHQIVHYPIIFELLNRGHNLTLFTPILMDFEGHENFTQYKLDQAPDIEADGVDMLSQKTKNINPHELWSKYEGNFRLMTAKVQIQNEKLQQLFKNPENNNFDLIIMECMLCPFAFLAEVYNCPIIMTSASQMGIAPHRIIGNSLHPAIHTEIYATSVPHGQLRIFDRILSLMYRFCSYKMETGDEENENEIFRESFPKLKFSSHGKVMRKSLKMFFGFTNKLTTSIRPETPNFHHTAFIHVKSPRNLTDNSDLKKFVDASKNGVIVVSFGSIVKDFDEKLFSKFTRAFERLPYNIIWKTGTEKYKSIKIPKNIFTSNWLPFSDLLAHQNVKLLITHSGSRTTEEAVDRMIPMILFPVSYDQPFNSRHLSDKKIAIELDLNNFTVDDLVSAVHEMTKEKYKENVQKFRQLVYDQMASSLDDSVDHIEYLINYKEIYDFQDYKGIDIHFLVRHNFDINAVLSLSFVSGIFISKLTIKFVNWGLFKNNV